MSKKGKESKFGESLHQLRNIFGLGEKDQPQDGVSAEDRKAEIEAQMRKLQEEKDTLDRAEADAKRAADAGTKEDPQNAEELSKKANAILKEANEKLAKAEEASKKADEELKKAENDSKKARAIRDSTKAYSDETTDMFEKAKEERRKVDDYSRKTKDLRKEAELYAEEAKKLRKEAEAERTLKQGAIEAARKSDESSAPKEGKGKLDREKGYLRLSFDDLISLNGGHLVDSEEIEDAEISGYIKSEQYAADTQETLDGGAPSVKLQTTVARMYKASPDMKAPEGMTIYDEFKATHRRPDGSIAIVPNAYQETQGKDVKVIMGIGDYVSLQPKPAPEPEPEPKPEPKPEPIPPKGKVYGCAPEEDEKPMVHPVAAIQERLEQGHKVVVTRLIKGKDTFYSLVEDARINNVEVLEYKTYYVDVPPSGKPYAIPEVEPTQAEKNALSIAIEEGRIEPIDVILVENPKKAQS